MLTLNLQVYILGADFQYQS